MKNENLNKENYFNGMMEKYPRATQQFCDWIDKYKKENNWDGLFNNLDRCAPSEPEGRIKFHNIPVEMQKGIIQLFVKEKFGTDMINFNIEGLKTDFMKLMGQLEEHIIEKQG